MNIANKLASGVVLAVVLVGVAYFISGSRQEKLQANVHTKVGDGDDFDAVAKACPRQVANVGADEADYTLNVTWFPGDPDVKEGWIYSLQRKDGATLEREEFVGGNLKTDPDATRIARQVCRDVQRDFPLWLNTQRVRASIGNAVQTESATSAETLDPPRRYEMTEYHNGPIVGIALLDTELGRAWLLTNLTDSNGKTVRSAFNEVSVEDLWQSAGELYETEARNSFAKWTRDQEQRFSRVKELTRPIAIQHAEDKADKARVPQ